MTPKVLAWDRGYANAAERALAAQANVRAGWVAQAGASSAVQPG
jgi:hypothetical protein